MKKKLGLTALTLLMGSGLWAQSANNEATDEVARDDRTTERTTESDDTTEVLVVTPSGWARRWMDTPDAVGLLVQKEIQERMFGQTPDILKGTPGVYIQHTAHGQGSPFIRGFTGKQVLMLVDGVRFNNSTFRFGPNQYLSSINPHTIDSIEVVRGPSSVLYGSDAQGGVINLILKEPEKRSAFDYTFGARGRFESANTRKEGGLFAEIGTSNFGAMTSATYADVDELTGGASIGRQPFTAYEEWGTFASLSADFGMHRLALKYMHYQQNDLERTDKVSPLVANSGNLKVPGLGNELRRRFVFQIDDMAILRWSMETDSILESIYVDASYHKQQETLERIKRPSSGRGTLRDQNYNVHTLGVNAQAILNFGHWARLTVGAELYHDIVHTRRADTNRDTGVVTVKDKSAQYPDWSQYSTFGIYAQNETTLLDEMFLFRYGVRFSAFRAQADVDDFSDTLDGVNATFSDITGALGIVYHPIHELAITLNLAKGFRAPNLDDLAASKGTGRGEQIPNPDLDPTVQYTADLGFKAYIPTVDHSSSAPRELQAQVNGFFSYFEDYLISVPTVFDGQDVVQLRNEGRVRVFGIEASVEVWFSQAMGLLGLPTDRIFFEGDALAFKANITYTRGDDLKNDTPVSRIPPVFGEVSMRYQIMGGDMYFEPFMGFTLRQDQYAPGNRGDVRFTANDEASYFLFGLRAGWYASEHAQFHLNIQNIGNRSYHPMGSGTFGSGTNVSISGEIRW